jgi:hypothetical protein
MRVFSTDELHRLPLEARQAHECGYREGYMGGQADAIEGVVHLVSRGISSTAAIDRLRRFSWLHLRRWFEARSLEAQRPELCDVDRHGAHVRREAPDLPEAMRL